MTVRGNGDRVLHDLHAAELQLRKIAQPFVMITRDVNDPRALANLAKDLLDHVVVCLRPACGQYHDFFRRQPSMIRRCEGASRSPRNKLCARLGAERHETSHGGIIDGWRLKKSWYWPQAGRRHTTT